MKITDEFLEVKPTDSPEVWDLRLEPEEAPAQCVQVVGDAMVGTRVGLPERGQSPLDGATPEARQANVLVTHETTAGKQAVKIKTECYACQHFNRPRFALARKAMSGTAEGRWELDNLRGLLLGTNNATLDDTESVMGQLGVCDAYTEHFHGPDVTVVAPEGGCPELGPDGLPVPIFFKPRNRAMKRVADHNYDNVINMARGHRPVAR